MPKTLLIVGDSPLNLLIAQELDQETARLAHLNVVLLSRDDRLIYGPKLTSLIKLPDFPSKKSLLDHVKVKTASVKQINLKEQRLTTEKEALDYDYLVLDQTPQYSASELDQISNDFRQLVYHWQAKQRQAKTVQAKLAVLGATLAGYQLALAAASDVQKLKAARSLKIQAEYSSGSAVGQFLKENNVGAYKLTEKLAGLRIKAPSVMVAGKTVRGAKIDHSGQIMVDHKLNPEGFPEVFVIGGLHRSVTNLLRADKVLAEAVAANIERTLEKKNTKLVQWPESAGLLVCGEKILGFAGRLASNRVRGRILFNLDQRLYRQLTKKA